jgi:hypothetical protein
VDGHMHDGMTMSPSPSPGDGHSHDGMTQDHQH